MGKGNLHGSLQPGKNISCAPFLTLLTPVTSTRRRRRPIIRPWGATSGNPLPLLEHIATDARLDPTGGTVYPSLTSSCKLVYRSCDP